MKPLNLNDQGCSPISSNCVIWQGPDIPCINLCKGDTITDVVYKLATELCTIIDELDISGYDLTCLNLGTATPESFQALIQYLITRLCETPSGSNNIPTDSIGGFGGGSCPDNCFVDIASCFYYTNEFGDQVTSMLLTDYVNTIGNRLCTLVSAITQIQATLANHETRITILENEPDPVVVIPKVIPSCVLPSVATDVNVVVQALEEQFCQLIGATGDSDDIYNAIVKQCAGLNNQDALGGTGGTMASITGWQNSVNNLAAAIGNIWLTICDVRSAVQSIQLNCCPAGCDGISLALQGVITGSNLTLYLTGTIPAGFTTCSPSGTLVTITDTSGASFTTYMDIVSYINNPSGFTINLSGTPVNLSSNLTVHMEPCLTNNTTGATCQSVLNEVVVNELNCPSMFYNPTTGSISYSGTTLTGTATYTMELWNNTATSMLSSQVQTLGASLPLIGTFLGLTAGTNYRLRLKVDVAGVITYCPFTSVATLPPTCAPATGVGSNISIP